MSTKKPRIAIDGPAGAGKGTVAKLLAKRLHLTFIDTGAMYRGVALASKRKGISWDDNDVLGELTSSLHFTMEGESDNQTIIMNGEDVTHAIREHDISTGASKVAAQPKVVDALILKQREMASLGNVVIEGRQIGTEVIPDAELKIYLTASPEVRAKRRMRDLEARGETPDFDDILAHINERDARDMNRPYAPLRKPVDAIEINTDDLTIETATAQLEELVKPLL